MEPSDMTIYIMDTTWTILKKIDMRRSGILDATWDMGD